MRLRHRGIEAVAGQTDALAQHRGLERQRREVALQLLDEEVRNNPISYPSDEVLENTQVYVNLSEETNLYLDRLWTEIMSAEAGYNYWSMPLFLVGALALSVAITVMKKNRRRRREQFNYQNSQNNF